MPSIPATFWRDGNFVPITTDGITTFTTTTFTGSNATVNTAIFTLTGAIEVRAIYGVVTTVLGANHTAAAYRLNDQTAQIYLTAIGGVDISGLAAGTVIAKKGLKATAISALDNAAAAVLEPTTLETLLFTPIVLVKKTGALTQIEYHYATTDTPTSGAMQHFVRWLPLSSDANLVAA